MAFEVSEKHIVKHWRFDFMDKMPGVRPQLPTESCAKMSYAGSFRIPKLLQVMDFSNTIIDKTVCVFAGSLSEDINIRNIPLFEHAVVSGKAYEDTAEPHFLVVQLSFHMEVPWVFTPAEGVISSYVREYMTEHINRTVARMCVA